MSKTPAILREITRSLGKEIPEILPSPLIWRAWASYRADNGDKPQVYWSCVSLEYTKALARIGTAPKQVDRVKQDELARISGIKSRPTVTKHITRMAGPDQSWTPEMRRNASRKMQSIVSSHPHWQGEKREDVELSEAVEIPKSQTNSSADSACDQLSTTGVVAQLSESSYGDLSRGVRQPQDVDPPLVENRPGPTDQDVFRNDPHRESKLKPFLVRHKAYGAPNSYSLATNAERPGLQSSPDPCTHARWLAAHFGSQNFDPTARVNGYRSAWGFLFWANLPDAYDCECVLQMKLKLGVGDSPEPVAAPSANQVNGDADCSGESASPCPKCQGRGYIIGGVMSYTGRLLLHFLRDRGIDEEIRRCKKCDRSYDQSSSKHYPNCPTCGSPGEVTKHRGILTGWTQPMIADFIGVDVSTVRRYFRAFARLGLTRTVIGAVWRKCCGEKLYQGACPKCGNKCGEIKSRDPWKILWLPSRYFDRELARAEQERLQASVRWHRRFLEATQQKALEAAVQLALRVLIEWIGGEHQLAAFYAEMRRRLDTNEHRRYANALFPNTS